jgi:hypothetical protein
MSLGDCFAGIVLGVILDVFLGVFLDVFLGVFLGVRVGWPARRFTAKFKSGIFLSKWHKKVAGLRGKHFPAGDRYHCTGNMILRQNAVFTSRPAGFPVSTAKGI